MTSIEREKIEALVCKAKTIRDAWLRERKEARALQISANAELREGWSESNDWGKTKPVTPPYGYK